MAKPGTPSKVKEMGSGRSADTKRLLIEAAIETLKEDGYSGASARAIAERAGSNQGLVFYHFGSVAGLLLAALDTVSAERLERYDALVTEVASPTDLVEVASTIFREDLDNGSVTVLAEMIAGASSTPVLGPEVVARIRPWVDFAERAVDRIVGQSALASVLPVGDVAYCIVALYLGLEMLSHLDGERARPLALFSHAARLAGLFQTLSGPFEGAPQ
jgi:AcrR family transcriptional regulator